ncbi:MAG TPA: ATP-binding cassette domain-containing protein [Candidatus Dormibacteraeota bacterium]
MPSPGEGQPLLELRGVCKNFGPVQALDHVDLALPSGKVTALVGDNGAGKTAMIKTISGIWPPDGGQIVWRGRSVHMHSPKEATALGITTVYQDLALCDNLDIVQNMFLGHEALRLGFLDEVAMELTARKTLDSLAVTTVRSMRQAVASLSGGQRQTVAVARAVMANSQLVILDEPTAALGVAQTGMVLSLVRRLASQGVTVLMVSHNLNDVFEVADRVAVLYLGHLVATGPASDFNRQIAVEYMTTGRAQQAAGQAGRQA